MPKKNFINSLKEKTSYEKWLLENLLEKLKNNQDSNYIIFVDNKYEKDFMKLHDHFGSNSRKVSTEIIKLLSPLIFGANYKILDIIMESILEKNKKKLGKFAEKINYLKDKKDDLEYPTLFDNNPELFDRLLKLYNKLRLYRNYLIHNKWGQNVDGDLHFNFNHRSNDYKLIVTFKQVISWAELLIICINILCKETNSDLNNYYIETIKSCLNDLKSIHGYKKLKTKSYRYFQIVSKNNIKLEQKKITINFNKIKNILEQRNKLDNISYICDLIIKIISPNNTQKLEYQIVNPKTTNNIQLIKKDNSFTLSKQ